MALKYIEEYRDSKLSKNLVGKIKRISIPRHSSDGGLRDPHGFDISQRHPVGFTAHHLVAVGTGLPRVRDRSKRNRCLYRIDPARRGYHYHIRRLDAGSRVQHHPCKSNGPRAKISWWFIRALMPLKLPKRIRTKKWYFSGSDSRPPPLPSRRRSFQPIT